MGMDPLGAQKAHALASIDSDFLYGQSLEYANKGDTNFALDLLNKAIALRPNFSMAWYQKGICLDQLGKCDEAVASYEKAISQDPYHADAWFSKGMVLKKLGRHEDGDQCMCRAVDLCCGR